jgi:dTDP-4-dehydrorhamnose reductase
MKLLILGADGQVGHALRESLQGAGDLQTSTRSGNPGDLPCDLSDAFGVEALLSTINPDVIVNAAAYTAVDRAEQDRDGAFALNSELPARLGLWAAQRGARVIHYSTDYVFDGTATEPYPESANPSPLGVYGRSKLEGEVRLAASRCRHLILRTAWVYGLTGRNFLLTMLRLARERDRLDVVGDQWGTPTSAPWIAESTRRILNRWKESGDDGVYHLTANGMTTWQGFAQEIVTQAASRGLLIAAPEVRGISTDEYPTPARRPAWSVLDSSLVEARFGVVRPAWPVLVHRVIDRMASSPD